MIGLVGAKGSGKTVLMTVLVKQLREVDRAAVRGRHQDRHRQPRRPSGTQRLPGQPGGPAVQQPHPADRNGPAGHARPGSGPRRSCCAGGRSRRGCIGGQALRSTVLSFVDTAGEDLNDLGHRLHPGVHIRLRRADDHARPVRPARRARPAQPAARRRSRSATTCPLDVVSRITELLRTEHKVKNKKRIKLPVAIVFTKIDAFYPTLDRQNPIMAQPPAAARLRERRRPGRARAHAGPDARVERRRHRHAHAAELLRLPLLRRLRARRRAGLRERRRRARRGAAAPGRGSRCSGCCPRSGTVPSA